MTPRECAVAVGCGAVLSLLALAALVFVVLVAPSVEGVVLAAGVVVLCVAVLGVAWRARWEASREREVDVLIDRILRG